MPANAIEFAPIALNTPGSFEIAFIAALSLASCLKATALLASRASAAALDAASRKALALFAKLANAEPFARTAFSASG
jgi:hypothetical protein